MSRRAAPPFALDLPGVDPTWSRRLDVPDADGIPRTWHLLERPASPESPAGTMLCLHGNPTWSYLWRRFLAAAPPGWRVIAPDQLGMGWSERGELPRTLAERIDDLGRLTDALEVTGPVVAVAHDWGGPILLGWAEQHRDLLAGIVLTNTGVAVPTGVAPPALIRLARSAPLLETVCVRTAAFVRGATAFSRPPLPREIRDAYASPYALPSRRRAVRDFVTDIPLEPEHRSRDALAGVVDGLDALADVPALLAWGPRDPVFSIRYLHDLRRRLPQADVQLYPRASHLVVEDAPEAVEDIWTWAESVSRRTTPPAEPTESTEAVRRRTPPTTGSRDPGRPLWAGLLERANDPATAIAELGPGAAGPISFADLERRVADLALGLTEAGIRPGQRVALLIRPGIDLTAAVYACWRAGASIVIADAGLGLRNLGRALRSADPDHLIAIPPGLVAAHALRVPGRRILAGDLPPVLRRRLRVAQSLTELQRSGRLSRASHQAADTVPPRQPAPELDFELDFELDAEAEAAVLFTSGATGPAKGVVYRHRQLRAQLDLVSRVCELQPGARLVAAFAPFALYGPALGAAAAVPDMDVTRPGTLTATALAEAVAAVDATVVFASPAALRNVAATASDLTPGLVRRLTSVRTLLSAGAPVPLPLLQQIQALLPHAELHTPYGMTEALPATDVTLPEIEQALADAGPHANGVCVGRPLPGVSIRIDPLAAPTADPVGQLVDHPGVTGEICLAAEHIKDHYDRLWATQRRSASPPGWHRTGDVGHLDDQGRLWVEGRLVHVVSGSDGPVTPVGVEQRVEMLASVSMAALVGIGPPGTQQSIAVVVPVDSSTRGPLAPADLSSDVRTAAGTPLAAVLVTDRLPVDIRHASKIDRARVARWADRLLAGGRTAGRRRP
ncbi:MAG TPA: alpha/beta fold hydrolase [Microlunatus sp.]|nr:alpha/beta fold hydrolase [Microlunatus sp.]